MPASDSAAQTNTVSVRTVPVETAEINVTGYVSIGDYGGGSARGNGTPAVHRQLHSRDGPAFHQDRIRYCELPPELDATGAYGLNTSIAQEAAFGRFVLRIAQRDQRLRRIRRISCWDILSTPTAPSPILFTPPQRLPAPGRPRPNLTILLRVRYGSNLVEGAEQRHGQFQLPTGRACHSGQFAAPSGAASLSRLTQSRYQLDDSDLEPRAGFAYQPFGNNKTVIRAGAGVYYDFLPLFIGASGELGFVPILFRRISRPRTPQPSLFSESVPLARG